ncbi:DUF4178 domain-containing protein [Mycobacterium camsae]|uniref:DUF4178 domain-containing protein n=1 Tax=Mycobacterium gordonae TaxID=1778 RepID=UPI00197E3D7C|nr:DUF4178 domain-containing protein [Mycobacterium gordonae]
MGAQLIVIAVALFIASLLVLVYAFKKKPASRKPGGRPDPLAFTGLPTEFGPRQLGPGAIISHGSTDYVVRGSVTYREGPFVWWEHLLEGGEEPVWFSVEEDDGRLELAMWSKRTDLDLQPGGAPTVDGVTMHEVERGHAGYTTEGTTGLPAGGEMDYVDYSGADKATLLSFERWAPDMPWEISTGRTVLTGEITVYPAPAG